MPNKTIYVKESDLPLWEEAQTRLGESLSSLFAEFLRSRSSIEGELHILKDPQGFLVAFGRSGGNGPMPSRWLRGEAGLSRFLKSIGIPDEHLAQALSEARQNAGVHISTVLTMAAYNRFGEKGK